MIAWTGFTVSVFIVLNVLQS